jgi:hypothetical protein
MEIFDKKEQSSYRRFIVGGRKLPTQFPMT